MRLSGISSRMPLWTHALSCIRKPIQNIDFKGTRKIQPADASYLYANRDKKKFSHWIANRTEECDSYDAVAGWLHDNGIKNPCVDDACADLLEKSSCRLWTAQQQLVRFPMIPAALLVIYL